MQYFFVCLAVFVSAQNEQDFIPTNFEQVSTPKSEGFGAIDRCGEGEKSGFKCVVYYKCDPSTNTTIEDATEENGDDNLTDYSLLIDIRFGETNPCPETLQVCCKTSNRINPSPPPPPQPKPTPPAPSRCGIRNSNGIDFRITGNTHNEAEYGEFPWMVAILKTNYNPSVDPVLAICGGSLITPGVVLTGAHCVHNRQPDELKVRAGEWDTQTENERYPYQERDISRIITHEGFKTGVLINDVALLILSQPFSKAKHVGTVCLPEANTEINSKECYATGWGKNFFGQKGQYQVILKKIDLPIVPHQECEEQLKQTRLGKHFHLHSSFTCAGGVEGKDTCTGDGGSPLVCPDPANPSRYVQAGIVAWGIGCGTTVPGVYADVAKLRGWIDEQMQRLNFNNAPYTL